MLPRTVETHVTRRALNLLKRRAQTAISAILAAAAVWLSLSGPAGAADSAVILMYHRFGESAFPSTNIRLAQFEAHIAELASGPYTVMSVPDIVAAIREGREPNVSVRDIFRVMDVCFACYDSLEARRTVPVSYLI